MLKGKKDTTATILVAVVLGIILITVGYQIRNTSEPTKQPNNARIADPTPQWPADPFDPFPNTPHRRDYISPKTANDPYPIAPPSDADSIAWATWAGDVAAWHQRDILRQPMPKMTPVAADTEAIAAMIGQAPGDWAAGINYFVNVTTSDGTVALHTGVSTEAELTPMFRMIAGRWCVNDLKQYVDVQVWDVSANDWYMPPGYVRPPSWDGKLRVQSIIRVGPAAY